MKKVNKIKLAVLFISMCCLVYPQTISTAQAPIPPDQPTDAQLKVDKLKAGTSQTLDSALKVAVSLPKLVNDLSAVRRKRKIIIQTEMMRQDIVVRYHGDVYEVPIEDYKGYAIIDIDSFLSANEDPVPMLDSTETPDIKPEPEPKRTFLQKLFNHNKNKSDECIK